MTPIQINRGFWIRWSQPEIHHRLPPVFPRNAVFSTLQWPNCRDELALHIARITAGSEVPTGTTEAVTKLLDGLEFGRDQSRLIRMVRHGTFDEGAIWLYIGSAPAQTNICALTPTPANWAPYPNKNWDRAGRRNPVVLQCVREERLLIDLRTGLLLETDTANILLRLGSVWYTPDWTSARLSGLFLPGITVRKRLLESPLKRRELTWDDLYNADEIAICNSVVGTLPALVRSRRPQPPS